MLGCANILAVQHKPQEAAIWGNEKVATFQGGLLFRHIVSELKYQNY